MIPTDIDSNAYADRLAELEKEGRLRTIPRHRSGEGYYNLTLNDYMAMGRNADLWRDEFNRRFGNVAMTSTASRLLASDQEIYVRLENHIADLYGKAALLFNSGYHANVGLVTALNLQGTLWLTDKLIHASVIDGIRMAHAECKRWNHNDASHLRKILEKESANYERTIVVCESIYSMDGDMAPLSDLVALKEDFPGMMLYVDEAHAIGAMGPKGMGLAAELGITEDIDFLVGTLGKACASVGAFVVTSDVMCRYLVNTARSLIFSTAIAPANAAWSLLMLERLESMDVEREHLATISERFRKEIERITGTENPSRSAIVPLLTGNAERAIEISRRLEEERVHALPIRRPTVPPGGERIRFSLNAALTEADIDNILEKIEKAYR